MFQDKVSVAWNVVILMLYLYVVCFWLGDCLIERCIPPSILSVSPFLSLSLPFSVIGSSIPSSLCIQEGKTLLHCAAENGQTHFAEHFLSLGADISLKDSVCQLNNYYTVIVLIYIKFLM